MQTRENRWPPGADFLRAVLLRSNPCPPCAGCLRPSPSSGSCTHTYPSSHPTPTVQRMHEPSQGTHRLQVPSDNSISICRSTEATSLPGSDAHTLGLRVHPHPHPPWNFFLLICCQCLECHPVPSNGPSLSPCCLSVPELTSFWGDLSVYLHFPASSYFSSRSSLAPTLPATRERFLRRPSAGSTALPPADAAATSLTSEDAPSALRCFSGACSPVSLAALALSCLSSSPPVCPRCFWSSYSTQSWALSTSSSSSAPKSTHGGISVKCILQLSPPHRPVTT